MKKFIPAIILLLVVFISPSLAQKVLTDGTIRYKVKVDVPPGNPQMAGVFDGSTFTLYVKGNRSRLDKHLGMFNQTILSNTSDGSIIVLMEAQGNKYLLRLTIADIIRQQPKYDGVIFTDTKETKIIAGYHCKKAIAKLKDGSVFPVYYTTEIAPGNAFIDVMFKNLKGVPLEYETTRQKLKMTIIAASVDLSPVPASLFDVPVTGYREVTLKELQQQRGR